MAPESGPKEQGDQSPGLPVPEEIICVLKKESGYEVVSLQQQQGDKDTKPEFKLSLSSYDHVGNGSTVASIEQHLLDDYLVHGLPEHIQPGPRRRVHVLVSTHSGTGLGMQFYSTVLAPLFQRLDLRPHEGVTTEEGAHFSQGGGSYNLVVTQDADSVKNFAQGIASGQSDTGGRPIEHTVVLLSGDGGIVDMLNCIASTEEGGGGGGGKDISDSKSGSSSIPLLALLPLGTGNALFNSLHKAASAKAPAVSDLVHGLRTLLLGKAAPLPSFKAVFPEGSRTITYSKGPEPASASSTDASATLEEHADSVTHLYGVVVASYGFHSQLVWESDTPAYRKHGAARFQMVAQELLKESHAYDATVEMVATSSSTATDTDNTTAATGRRGRDRHAYVLATLVSNLEKTFCISPDSRPLDSQLRLVHFFGPTDGAKTMEIMMAAYDGGKHVGLRWSLDQDGEGEREEAVGYEQIDELRITTHEEDKRWRKVCIDGTIVEIPRDGCMVVRREARHHLRVLVDTSIAS
ncbi:ATP-NAD kinase-like domain-containing protein [Xylariaceae sp. FL0594]|nr:ATP-NAD kinase-like domain-containing protein [Xylariaceae sp. FL0594]